MLLNIKLLVTVTIAVVLPPKMYEKSATPGISMRFTEQVKFLGVLLHASLKDDNET